MDVRCHPILFTLFHLPFSLYFSFSLILFSIFLFPIVSPYIYFVLSIMVAHYFHYFNLLYTPPVFPLSVFSVAITVSMILPLMCQTS